MTHTFSYSIDNMCEEIEKFARLVTEHKERELAEIITKYDFIVGSKELKHKLLEVLPEGANVICSPYIESPTMIYAIKKWDIMDLLFEPQESGDYDLRCAYSYDKYPNAKYKVVKAEGSEENESRD